MASVTVPVTEAGIVLPRSTTQLLGCRVGDWARVEVKTLPSAYELKGKALYHILHHLGDAVCVGDPVWVDEGWRLDLGVKGRKGVYGQLLLAPDGEVIEERSTSRAELLETLDAEDTDAATGQ